MHTPVVSPFLIAFLRAIVFVGLTEAIFYRLLPAPSDAGGVSLLEKLHASVDRAGSLTFLLAFILVIVAILNVAHRSLRVRLWPAGLNGFLVVCLVCLAGLGLAAMITSPGPVFAMAFTLLSIATFMFVAMHGFAGESSTRARIFIVCYAAGLLCSSVVTLGDFASWLPGTFLTNVTSQSDAALAAGSILMCAAAVFAFLAYANLDDARKRSGSLFWFALGVSLLAAGGLAAGSTLAPARLALLGSEPGLLRVLMLSFTLFTGTLTAILNLLKPETRLRGYGLLLLLLAGFPAVIAHQQLLVILGSVLVFAPWHAVKPRLAFQPETFLVREPGNP